MRAAAMLVLLAVAFAPVLVSAQNPVEGVTKLLTRLKEKVAEEGKAEAAAYDKFACFCKDQADEKLYSITKKTEKINALAASIKALTMEIEDFNLQMDEATTRKDELEKESKAAKDKSFSDLQDFLKFKDDHVTALDELDKAIAAVKESQELTKSQLLLLQKEEMIRAEMEADPKAYASKGGGVLDKLIQLKVKFSARLLAIEDDESERKHSVAMQQQARNFEINALKDKITKCQDVIGKDSAQKSSDEGEKASLESDRADEQAFMDKLTEECEAKATAWDARSKRRFGELTALAKALDILKGDATAKYEAAAKNLAAVQVKQHDGKKGHWVWVPSFLQVSLSARDASEEPAKKKVIAALAQKAASLKSSALYELVLKLRDSPFKSVVKLIEGLIDKIKDEQKAEDTEIEDCKNDILDATSDKSKMQAKMEEEEATIIEKTSLADVTAKDITELANEITELEKALADATQLRNAEKAENETTMSDATAGLFSVKKAIKVLKDFYTEEYKPGFLQESSKRRREEPELGAPDAAGFLGDDAAADPASEESTGVFAVLEVIAGDFQNAIDKTQTDEDDAQAEFETFSGSTNSEIDAKSAEKRDNEKKKRDAEATVATAKDDLAEWTQQKTQAEYDLSILQPRCLGLGASAVQKKERREQEVKSLEDAMKILETMMPAEAPAPTEPEEFLQRRAASRHA